ncbi:MAG: MFS transporter [Cyanobacteria bacterium P01_E01_bin.45]
MDRLEDPVLTPPSSAEGSDSISPNFSNHSIPENSCHRTAEQYTDPARINSERTESDRLDPARTESKPAIPSLDPACDAPTEGSYADVLQNKNFLVLWAGQIFSQLADKVFLVLLVAIVSSHFALQQDSISAWVAAIMVAFTIPAVLFGSIAGVYVDRWSKKWVMVGTNVVRGVLVLAVPLLLLGLDSNILLWGWPLDFVALLGITFAVSTLTQFFAPAEQTAIPLIVRKRNLLPANSLYTTTMMASVIIGFAIGEPLLALANRASVWLNWGPELGSELAVGGGYAIAGALLLAMVTGEHRQPSRDAEGERRVWQDIREGLRYLGRSVRVRSAIGQMVILFSIFAALAVLAVRLAELIPDLSAAQFGVLLAAAGAGMGIGALVVGQWGAKLSRQMWSAIGSGGVAASLLVLALIDPQLWPSAIAIAGLGCAGAMVGVPMQTLIQEETPAAMRGKVFGLQNNLVNIALSLPLALASVAEHQFGLSPVLMTLAALSVLSGLVGWATMGADADTPC